jgi:hypothetical protein
MRRGEAILERAQSAQEQWKAVEAKVHPALLEMATLFKEFVETVETLYKYKSRELLAPVEAEFDKRCEEIFRRFSGPVQPPNGHFPSETIFAAGLATHSEEIALAEFLHWERHKVPHTKDIERLNHRDGNAARRVLRTMADYEGIRCDKKRPKPFKGKADHSSIFGFGLGLGLENLSGEELAIFFDRFCPSCREVHNADALRRQRTEFLRALERAGKPTRADK